jgi:hypothetical protein
MAKHLFVKALASKMSAQEALITHDELLGILAAIAKDRKIDVKDRLYAIRVHSRMLGFQLSDVDVW